MPDIEYWTSPLSGVLPTWYMMAAQASGVMPDMFYRESILVSFRIDPLYQPLSWKLF